MYVYSLPSSIALCQCCGSSKSTGWILLTAIKLLSQLIAALHRPQDQSTAALRAVRVAGMAFSERSQMLLLRFSGRQPQEVLGPHAAPDSLFDLNNVRVSQKDFGFPLDVAKWSATDDVGRQYCLQSGRFADEAHHRVEHTGWQRQEFFKGFHVAVVLAQRVLESEFFPIQRLCPLGIVLAPKYPSLHVLRLDDEYPVSRYDDVINLRRAIRGGNGHVVDVAVHVPIQDDLLDSGEYGFTQPTLERRQQAHLPQPATFAFCLAATTGVVVFPS